MWIETQPETLETPGESKSTAPVYCATCVAEHDEEDDFGESFKYIDEKAYCIGECYSNAAQVAYRVKAAELIREALAELQEKCGELYEELGTDGNSPLGSPMDELEDLVGRLPRWEAGKDTGYRSEMMMSSVESIQLRIEARTYITDLLVKIGNRSAGNDVD